MENALSGVTVLIRGTNRATTMDADGNYRIAAKPVDRLVLSFVGYATREVPVTMETKINVTLTASAREMEQVVIGIN